MDWYAYALQQYALVESNHRPVLYKNTALTAELRARNDNRILSRRITLNQIALA